jgi:hypothetical protein
MENDPILPFPHKARKFRQDGVPPLFSILKAAQPPYDSAGDPFGRLFSFPKPPLPEQFFRVFLTFIGTLLSGELCVDNSIQSVLSHHSLFRHSLSLFSHSFMLLL